MPEQKVQTNPTKVIREKCIDCCCGNMAEVARCTAEKCPLHPWRMGKNPYRKPPSAARLEATRRMNEKRWGEKGDNAACGTGDNAGNDGSQIFMPGE